MIERQWSPCSRDLSGLIVPACLPGEDKLPSQQTDLTEQQKMEKQKQFHKAAMAKLCSIWNGRKYNGYPVIALPAPDDQDDIQAEENIEASIHAGVGRLRDDPALQSMLAEIIIPH